MKSKLLSAVLVSGILSSAAVYAQTTQYDVTNANPISTTSDVSSPNTVSGPYAITDESVTTQASNGDDDLLVYPNPAVSATRIVLNNVPGSAVYVEVIDMNGEIDRSFEYSPGSYFLDVDLSNLPDGMYSVRVSGSDVGYHNLKVIKQ